MQVSSKAAAALGIFLSLGVAPLARGQEQLQLLRNGGFAEDELTFRGENASSCGGNEADQYFNQQDLFPDGWTWPGVYGPGAHGGPIWPRPEVTIDKVVHHGGAASLRLETRVAKPATPGAKPGPAPAVTINQTFEWNTVANLYREVGPDGKVIAPVPFLVKAGLHQDMVLNGWCRTQDVPKDGTVKVILTLAGAGTVSLDLPKGTNAWQAFTVTLPAATLEKSKAPGTSVEVQLSYTSPTGAGQVWFDDLTLTTAARPEPNLLPNGSFEDATTAAQAPETPRGPGSNLSGAAIPAPATPYPTGWTKPAKWVFFMAAGRYYYVWNNWQHFFTEGRGTPRLDSLVAHSGHQSLRFDLYGGDEYSTDSPPMVLNQGEARPIEVTAWVKADRLRHFDLMIVDQDGQRLPKSTDLTYYGGQAAGTHDWIAVREVFQPVKSLKSVRLRIAARGFNGLTETDIGVWHAYNQVSTLWVDDVAVREMYSTAAELNARGIHVASPLNPPAALHLAGLDLGERLWGENELGAVVQNDTGAPARVALEVQLTTPSGKELKAQRGAEKSVPAGGTIDLTAPYTINELSPSWRQPGRMRVTLLVNGKPVGTEAYGYGTWPVVADVRPSKAFIDETENPILVAINLGVARKTLEKAKHLKIEVVDRRTGKTLVEQEIKDLHAAIAAAVIPDAAQDRFYFYMPRAGLLDMRNLILQEMDISKLPLRPWDDPEADWCLRVSSKGMFSETFPSSDSHFFGRLTKLNEVLPPIHEVTIDPVGHFFRVNGKPFIPIANSHANGSGVSDLTRSVGFTPARGKLNGLNGVSRWQGTDALTLNWASNLYVPMFMSGSAGLVSGDPKEVDALMTGLSHDQIEVAKNYGDGRLQPLGPINNDPSWLCYLTAMDEAILECSAPPAGIKADTDYADAVRKKIHRPVGIMDNHSQYYPWHDDDHFLDHFDALYMEREEGSLWRPGLTVRNWMRHSKSWVLLDLPQTYENVPHERERYRSLVDVMQGARGWFGIQGCADPSLYRELGGELRHEFTFWSANEGTPKVEAPVGITAMAWKKGDRVLVMAEQHNPVPRGRWTWKDVDGKPAHAGVSAHLTTPIKNGYAIHGYNDDLYREVAASDKVRQEVYIPAGHKPQAIFLVVPGNGDFNHVAYWGTFDPAAFHAKHADAFLAGECYSSAAYGINWYRGGVASWDAYQAAHRFPASCFVKLGELPPAGQWATLEVPLAELGLKGRVVDGLMFMSSGVTGLDDQAWWGKSTLVRAGGAEEPMIDGRIGRNPETFNKVAFSLPDMPELKNGTVRVVGEDRTLKLVNGQWTDNLHGEVLYDSLNDGYLGDGFTYGNPVDSLPEALELGYSYDASPRCLRVYEVIPGK